MAGRVGALLWASRYNGTGDNYDGGSTITVSPSGAAVVVTGVSVRLTAVALGRGDLPERSIWPRF